MTKDSASMGTEERMEAQVEAFRRDLADTLPRPTDVSLLREIATQLKRNGLLLERILAEVSK